MGALKWGGPERIWLGGKARPWKSTSSDGKMQAGWNHNKRGGKGGGQGGVGRGFLYFHSLVPAWGKSGIGKANGGGGRK